MRLGPVARFVGFTHLALAATMVLPAAVAASDPRVSATPYAVGAFVAVAIAGLSFAAGLGFARRPVVRGGMRELLLALIAFWGLGPFVAGLPFTAGQAGLFEGWFEAVTALTTTGAWLSQEAARADGPAILYRAALQWLGGFVSLATAASTFVRPEFIGIAPLVPPFSRGESGSFLRAFDRASWTFLPVYAGITGLGLMVYLGLGVPPIDATAMAMSFIATGGFVPALEGFSAYPVAAIPLSSVMMTLGAINFILLARFALGRTGRMRLAGDQETTAFLLLIGPVTLLYFLSVGAGDLDRMGAQMFNAISLLSTNGLTIGETPPLTPILVTAIIGGAAVSTAGGIKLLRWLITIRRTGEELWRLTHPGAVRHGNPQTNEIGVWIHTLAFTLLLAIVVLVTASFGYALDASVGVAVASIANAGPLIAAAQQTSVDLIDFEPPLRVILGVTMIAGRLELIILLVMVNRRFWIA